MTGDDKAKIMTFNLCLSAMLAGIEEPAIQSYLIRAGVHRHSVTRLRDAMRQVFDEILAARVSCTCSPEGKA